MKHKLIQITLDSFWLPRWGLKTLKSVYFINSPGPKSSSSYFPTRSLRISVQFSF